MPTVNDNELKMLQIQVSQHQEEIAAIKQSTREQISAQSRLIDSIQELTGVLREHTVRHEHVSKTQESQESKLTKLDEAVQRIDKQQAANQGVIDGVRQLNAKMIWLIIAAIAAPAVAIFSSK